MTTRDDPFAAVRRPVPDDELPARLLEPPWSNFTAEITEDFLPIVTTDHREHGAPFGDTVRGAGLWWLACAWARHELEARGETDPGTPDCQRVAIALAEKAPWVVDDSLPPDGKAWD